MNGQTLREYALIKEAKAFSFKRTVSNAYERGGLLGAAKEVGNQVGGLAKESVKSFSNGAAHSLLGVQQGTHIGYGGGGIKGFGILPDKKGINLKKDLTHSSLGKKVTSFSNMTGNIAGAIANPAT